MPEAGEKHINLPLTCCVILSHKPPPTPWQNSGVGEDHPWSPISLFSLHFSMKAEKRARRQAVGTPLALPLPTPKEGRSRPFVYRAHARARAAFSPQLFLAACVLPPGGWDATTGFSLCLLTHTGGGSAGSSPRSLPTPTPFTPASHIRYFLDSRC